MLHLTAIHPHPQMSLTVVVCYYPPSGSAQHMAVAGKCSGSYLGHAGGQEG